MGKGETIYLAGGCFWGVEELFRQIKGVRQTTVGYANGTGAADANYRRVCAGGTGFKETVRVEFDSATVPVERILWAYFKVIDPTLQNRQGADIGEQYQAGVYWEPDDEELGAAVREACDHERTRVLESGRPFYVEVRKLQNFYAAEDYHQRYLVNNPGGYCHISRSEMAEVLSELG